MMRASSTFSLSYFPLLLLRLSYLECTGLVRAQGGDGGAADGIQPGSLGAESDDQQGAASSGPDTGSANLSHGAVIAIAVVVSLVVVLGTTTAVLFFLAKKRQWKIREGLRRSARKVTSAVKAVATPLTPKRMTFSPIESRSHRADREKGFQRAAEENTRLNKSNGKQRDVEKDVPLRVEKVKGPVVPKDGQQQAQTSPSRQTKGKPKPPNVKIPPSAFEMDSPKTPVWKRVFGR